jgi:hypothetical protein
MASLIISSNYSYPLQKMLKYKNYYTNTENTNI